MILFVFAIVALVVFTCYQAKWTMEQVSLTEQEIALDTIPAISGKPTGFVSFPNIFPTAQIIPVDSIQTVDVVPPAYEVGTVFVEEPLFTYPTPVIVPVVAVVDEVAEVASVDVASKAPSVPATALLMEKPSKDTLIPSKRSEGQETGYAVMGVRELRPLAVKRGITGSRTMSKAQLVAALSSLPPTRVVA